MQKRGVLGSADIDISNYWTNGKGSQELRCNETVIYAEIDVCQAYVSIATTQEEVQEQYSKMDMFYLCLEAIELYHSDASALRKAGVVIGNMLADGCFSIDFGSIEEENKYVCQIVVDMQRRVQNWSEKGENSNFMEWYVPNVCDLNYYHNADGTKTVDKPKLMGVGATYTDDYWSKQMKEGGMYCLYLVTDTDGSNGGDQKKIERKKIQQMKHLNYMHGAANNMTINSMLRNAEAGIVEKSGKTPSDCLKKLKTEKEGGTSGLGDPITIVTAIISAIVAIIKLVQQAKAQKEEIRQMVQDESAAEPTENQMNQNKPSPDDWLKMAAEEEQKANELEKAAKKAAEQYEDAKDGDEKKNSPLVWIGGAALAGLAIIGVLLWKRKSN
jgi:hypothetical protein